MTFCLSPFPRSGSEESVKVWDVQTHQELVTLPGQGSIMRMLAFTPDGNKLVGLNNAGRLPIWRAPPWEDINPAGRLARPTP